MDSNIIQNDYNFDINDKDEEYLYMNDRKILRKSINEDVIYLKEILI